MTSFLTLYYTSLNMKLFVKALLYFKQATYYD